MSFKVRSVVLTLSAVMVAGPLQASDVYVYPAQRQTTEQQAKDEYDCYTWAKNDTGFDPMASPTATDPAPTTEKKSGRVARGVLGGAALGAIIGDRSKYAAIGAAAGGLFAGARQSSHNRKVEQEQAQWEQEQSAQYAQQRNNYTRAYAACLEGRGYTVK